MGVGTVVSVLILKSLCRPLVRNMIEERWRGISAKPQFSFRHLFELVPATKAGNRHAHQPGPHSDKFVTQTNATSPRLSTYYLHISKATSVLPKHTLRAGPRHTLLYVRYKCGGMLPGTGTYVDRSADENAEILAVRFIRRAGNKVPSVVMSSLDMGTTLGPNGGPYPHFLFISNTRNKFSPSHDVFSGGTLSSLSCSSLGCKMYLCVPRTHLLFSLASCPMFRTEKQPPADQLSEGDLCW